MLDCACDPMGGCYGWLPWVDAACWMLNCACDPMLVARPTHVHTSSGKQTKTIDMASVKGLYEDTTGKV